MNAVQNLISILVRHCYAKAAPGVREERQKGEANGEKVWVRQKGYALQSVGKQDVKRR